MHMDIDINIRICIYIHKYVSIYMYIRPTQSMIYDHLLVNTFQKIVLLIVRYKYLKSCSDDSILQNLILRTRLCGTGFSTQPSWILHFHPTKMVGWKCFVPLRYQLPRGISGGLALQQFYIIYRVGRIHIYLYIYIYI